MFEAIIRQIFKNHRSHLLLSTLDLVLLKELTSSTSYHTRITARQVMNFIWQNLDSEFLVTDSRLSQPNKELLVTCSNNALTYIWIRNINKTTKCFTAHWHSEEPRACVTSFRTSVRSHANACDNHEIIVRQEDWYKILRKNKFPLLTYTYYIGVCLLIQPFSPLYRVCTKKFRWESITRYFGSIN